jgi:threonylcarbamoyladenosine tRNA methylthiotransferase MtaB
MKRFSKLQKMCHHFHLSLQSGCTKTLERMNRRYTANDFEEITKRIRNTYDDSILTTDVIVGFPGETDEEFNETYEFLKKIKFYKMHIFKFSVRKGTKAEKMENQISPEVKESRSKILLELSNKNENEYLQGYKGKEVSVLIEEKEGDFNKGHTANYLMLKIKSDEDFSNQMKNVKIIDVENLELIGKII